MAEKSDYNVYHAGVIFDKENKSDTAAAEATQPAEVSPSAEATQPAEVSPSAEVIQVAEVTQMGETMEMKEFLNEKQDKIFDDVLTQVSGRLGNIGINAKTLILIVKYVIEAVEGTPVKGAEQKLLAVRVITQLVKDAPLGGDEEKLCLTMIEHGLVGDMIELVVDASHGRLNLNAAQDVAKNCCMAFCNKYQK